MKISKEYGTRGEKQKERTIRRRIPRNGHGGESSEQKKKQYKQQDHRTDLWIKEVF